MQPILMSFYSLQQRSNLAPSPSFVPAREPRAQMQAKHARFSSGGNNFEKRMSRSGGIVPLVIRYFLSTQKTDRMIATRGPERKTRRDGQSLDHVRTRCFLKHDEIRRDRFDHLRQLLLATYSTESDVVTE